MRFFRLSPNNKTDPAHICELAKMSREDDSTDVLGSYTGTAADGEPPVQDADDL